MTRPRPVRAVGALALALGLALTAGACSDDGLDTGGEKGYVSGDGRVATFAVDERREVPVDQIAGPALGGDGEVAVSDFRGKVVVLNVWGSWCPPCRAEAPDLVRAYEALGAGPDADVVFLGVDIREPSQAPALAFERTFDVPYPSIFDPGGQALLPLGLPSVPPTTVVLDPQGRIAATVLGELPSSGTLVDLVQDVQAES